jgi:hypothetical protein
MVQKGPSGCSPKLVVHVACCMVHRRARRASRGKSYGNFEAKIDICVKISEEHGFSRLGLDEPVEKDCGAHTILERNRLLLAYPQWTHFSGVIASDARDRVCFYS